jgi:hypothetical protein
MLKHECEDTAWDTAYHEAGHPVAGMGVGLRPLEVHIRADGSGGVDWVRWAEGQALAQVQRDLVHVVAGPVAEFLYELACDGYSRIRWKFRLDPGDWEASYRLVSARVRRGEAGDAAARCDTYEAHLHALEACRRLRLMDRGEWDERRVRADPLLQHGRGGLFWHRGLTVGATPTADGGVSYTTAGPVTPPEVGREEVLAEVVRAERWAGRLLERRWDAVVAVAEALFHSPGGVLTGREVEALVAARPGPRA